MHCVSLTFLIFLHPTMDKQSNILVNLQACASVVDHKKSLWHLCADYKHIQVGKMPPLTLRKKKHLPSNCSARGTEPFGPYTKATKGVIFGF